jgi:hypothetical protein
MKTPVEALMTYEPATTATAANDAAFSATLLLPEREPRVQGPGWDAYEVWRTRIKARDRGDRSTG